MQAPQENPQEAPHRKSKADTPSRSLPSDKSSAIVRLIKGPAGDFLLVFLSIALGYLVANMTMSPHYPLTIAHYPKNTLLFIVSGDANNYTNLMSWARDHNLAVAVWDLDRPPALFTLGDVNVPLTPPVISVPTYICRAADKNTLIGYNSTDEDIFRLVVSHCYGYEGPRYIYDNNTHQVIEVNS